MPCFGPKFKQKQAIIMGLENSGKTSLLYRTKFDGHSDLIFTEPTIGFNQEQITFSDQKVKLKITDLPGAEGLHSIWPHFITSKLDGIIFVIDADHCLNDYEYLLDCKDIFWRTLDENHKLDTVPVIIFLNKMDKAKDLISKINKYKSRGYFMELGEPEADFFNDKYFGESGFNLSKWFSKHFDLNQLSWRSYLVQPCSTKRSNPKVMFGMNWLISKMISKTQGKDQTVNLTRRDSTHVVTRRHKKFKPKERKIIVEEQPMPCVIEEERESIVSSNPYQDIDDRLSQMYLENCTSRQTWQDNRRELLRRDFSSDDSLRAVVKVGANKKFNVSPKPPKTFNMPTGARAGLNDTRKGPINNFLCPESDLACVP